MRCAVTGASRGLGLGICEVLAARGDAVVALCRRSTPELRALGVEVVEDVDVADEHVAARLGDLGALDVLISNAAVNLTYDADLEDLDLGDMTTEYRVNVVGAARVVQAVTPRLRPGAKVVLVSGGGVVKPGRVASPGNYGYRMSKTALNAFGFMLAEELRPRGIAVLVVNPGVMDTDMHRSVLAAGRGNPNPGVPPLEAAREVVARVDELALETSGAWLQRSGEPIGV